LPEIWELTWEQRQEVLESGLTEEDIAEFEERRKREYLELKETAMSGMDLEEFEGYYRNRYGIDHTCTCAEDIFLKRLVSGPRCHHVMRIKMRDRLEEVLVEKDTLAEQVDMLRMQVAELGAEPRV
jgi:hypothetical protein